MLRACATRRCSRSTPPAIQGLGQSEGFDFELQASAGTDRAQLARLRDQLLAAAAQDPKLVAVRRGDLPETPQLKIDIDHAKAVCARRCRRSDITDTLTAAWGGVYVNDFIDRGRVKRVFVQGDAAFRSEARGPRAVVRARRDRHDDAVLGVRDHALDVRRRVAVALQRPRRRTRSRAWAHRASSSGTAMDEMEKLASQLPARHDVRVDRAIVPGAARRAARRCTLYAISILVIFLCLAALYESWSVPFSVLLVIPLGIVGAVIAANLRGLENDVYFRVALLTTMGCRRRTRS